MNKGQNNLGARVDILAAIDAAEASLARDAGRVITSQTMREIKQRGPARLAAETAR